MSVQNSAECRVLHATRSVKTIACITVATKGVEICAFLAVKSVPGSVSITSAAKNVVSCVTDRYVTSLATKLCHATTIAVV